jgi:hypothetical protein
VHSREVGVLAPVRTDATGIINLACLNAFISGSFIIKDLSPLEHSASFFDFEHYLKIAHQES